MRNKITAGNSLALMIDMQTKLMPPMAHRQSVTARTEFFLSSLRIPGIPVLVTQQYTRGLGMTLPELNQVREAEEYIEKITYSCWDSPEFRTVMASEPARTNILLFGVETHICVLQTALDLKEEGYQVFLVCDCTDSRCSYDRDTAITRMIQNGIIPVTSESVIYEILGRAGTPEFKKISSLVKNAPLFDGT